MVNKKGTPTRPQAATVPQRKAAVSAKRPATDNGAAAKKPQRAVTAPPQGSGIAARFEGFQRLYRETIAELRKVQWPDRTTTRNLTLVVIGMSTALAVILGLLDAVLTRAVEWLVRLPFGV